MHAFIIDPWERTIERVDHDGTTNNIYKQLTCLERDHVVTCFDACRLDHGDAVFVDDEGLFKGVAVFMIGDAELAGCGMVIGSDSQGDSAPPKISIDELRGLIKWQVVPGFRLYAAA